MLSVYEPYSAGCAIIYELETIYARCKSAYQDAIVAETVAYGRVLFLDGLIQSAQADEAIYHEAMIHPAMMIHGGVRRVLVAGAGEGATLRELVRYPSVEKIVAVDLDRDVIELCKVHLPDWHQGAFDDPRVELRIEDVQDTLRDDSTGVFDLIVLDITDPVEDGPSVDLFTREFYQRVAEKLAPGGLIVLQGGELDPSGMETPRTVRSTLASVFPWVHYVQAFVPSFHCLWGFALAAPTPFELHPSDLDARLETLSDAPLRVYDAFQHRNMLTLPRYLHEMLMRPGKVLSELSHDRLIAYGSSQHGAGAPDPTPR